MRHSRAPVSTSSSPSFAPRMTPAQWTSASAAPSSSSAAVRAAPSARSTASPRKRSCASVAVARSRPDTRHPSRSSRSATAWPMPELVPVTTAWRIRTALRALEVDALQELTAAHDLAADELAAVLDALRDRLEQRAGQALDDLGIAHRLLDHRVDRRLDLARRALGRPDAVPGVKLEARQPSLGHGRDVRREYRAFRGGDADRAHLVCILCRRQQREARVD